MDSDQLRNNAYYVPSDTHRGHAVFVAANNRVNPPYGHDIVATEDVIPHHWSGCVFRARNDEIFREVSFITMDNNIDYEVYVNKLGYTEPEDPGTPSTPLKSDMIYMAGYHTVKLLCSVRRCCAWSWYLGKRKDIEA